MAITVAFDGVRLHDMGDSGGDSTTGISSISGQAPGAEPDFKYQGDNAISKKVTTTQNGIQVDTSSLTPSSADFTAADRQLWFAKIQATNKDALDVAGTPAGIIRAGSGSSAYNELECITGSDGEGVFYPIVGGFLLLAWNPDVTELRDSQTGSPVFTAADYFAYACDFSATSRAENVIMDAIDIGRGLTLVGSTPDGEFQDFVDFDEGDGTTGRFGIFSTKEGIIYCLGRHWIGRNDSGTTTATDFVDIARTIVFPNSFFDTGDAGFDIDLGNGATVVVFDAITLISSGIGLGRNFGTFSGIDSASDEIRSTDLTEFFNPGDAVTYRKMEGVDATGATDGTVYFIGKDMVTAPTGVTLHTTRADAMNASGQLTNTPVNLTQIAIFDDDMHRLERVNDTRADLLITGNTGTFAMTGGSIENFRVVTFTDACTIDGVAFRECEQVIQAGADIDNCSFIYSNQNVQDGGSSTDVNGVVVLTDPALFTTCRVQGTIGIVLPLNPGPLVEVTAAGTYAWTDNVMINGAEDFGISTDQTVFEFDNTDDVSTGSDTITIGTGHGYTAGDIVYYTRTLTANTALSALVEGRVYYTGNVTATTVTLHNNRGEGVGGDNTIDLTAGTGNETHAIYPGNASIFNNSGGLVTLSSNGAAMTVCNALDSTTVINNDVTVTFDNLKDDTEVRIYAAGTKTELDGIENATAGTTDDRNFPASIASGTDVDYVLLSLPYEYIRVEGFTWPSDAQTLAIQQRVDRNYENPA